MSFNIFEIANFLGRPVCLYTFQWGNTYWRYTSADRNITFDGNLYTAIPISDSGFTQGVSAQDFVVTMPRATPLVDLFRSTPPSSPITLTCRRFHKDDPAQEAIVYWVGTVGNVRGKTVILAEVLGLPISGTIRRTGLRKCWERNCNNVLYDQDCKANKDLFKTDTTITALSGTTITVASLGAWTGPQYSGGFIEWIATAEGTIDRRGIDSWGGGNVLNLFGSSDRLIVGQAVSIMLGCDLTAETCNGTFNNLANNSGFKFMAGKSPFDGNPVF